MKKINKFENITEYIPDFAYYVVTILVIIVFIWVMIGLRERDVQIGKKLCDLVGGEYHSAVPFKNAYCLK